MATKTRDIGTHALHWLTRGTTIAEIRPVRSGTAAEMRAVWDYRKAGLTVDQARAEISAHCPAKQNHGGMAGIEQRDRSGARLLWLHCIGLDGEHGWGRNVRSWYSGEWGRILMMQRERCVRRAEFARLVQGAQGVAAWLAWRPAWNDASCGYVLPTGYLVKTVRHEHAEWGRKRGHYPTHTELSYTTTLHNPSGDPARDVSVTHDARGDWRTRALVALGGVSPSHAASATDMYVRLHRACRAVPRHSLRSGVMVGERTLCGVHVDYYASDGRTAYHAETVREAIIGLSRKVTRAAAKASGQLLSADIARERWGFCRQGLQEFAAATGLDITGEYTQEEVKAAITGDVRGRFAADLEIAGL